MAYNATNPVTVGAATKKDHYDRSFDNTVALYAGAMSIPSQATNDIPFFSSASQIGRVVSANSAVMVTSAGGVPSLATTLPAVDGSALTGLTFAGLSPLTTRGDTLVASSGVVTGTRLPLGAAGAVLTSDGSDAAWTAPSATVNPGVCQGRLTLTSGVPVTSADVANASTLYWTPYKGNSISLYSGSAWVSFAQAELSLSLSGYTASRVYDIFIDHNGGSPQMTSLIWTDDTTRATALTTQDGVLVLTGDTEQRYVGTIFIDATGGETNDGSGQSATMKGAMRDVWNYYNRVPRAMHCVEYVTSWTYTTATWRLANAGGATGNKIHFVIGWPEVPVTSVVAASSECTLDATILRAGIGLDSTSDPASSGGVGYGPGIVAARQANPLSADDMLYAYYTGHPGIGRHYLAWLEYSSANGTSTWYGDSANAQLHQTGIQGMIEG